MVDVARRLCDDNHIYVSEIWSYHAVGDQIRFTMVYRNKEAPPAAKKAEPAKKTVAPRNPTPSPRKKPAVQKAVAKKSARPAKKRKK
jgi:hypothetical protein